MLLINQSLVEKLGTMRECIEVIDVAMRDVTRGLFRQPARQVLGPVKGKLLGLMPGIGAGYGVMGAKLISVSDPAKDPTLAAHQGVVALFDTESGLLSAIVDAGSVTAMRTAAASAVATRCLSRPDSRVLALIGSGHQARAHLEAIRLVRPIERAVVWSRSPENAEHLARAYRAGDFPIGVAKTVEEAVSGADIICTLTSSAEPVLHGKWLRPGQHVNAVGASIASRRELDEEAVGRARFFADLVEFVREQGGEYLAAVSSGRVAPGHLLGNIGAVLDGELAGRTSPSDITVYKSLGLIAQDLAWSRHLARKAAETGACDDIPFAARAH